MEAEILELFRECSSVVWERISRMKREDFGDFIEMGADGTPTKRIDEVAEGTAVDFFTENCDYNLLSEEVGIIEGDEQGTIIMDPIDGTTNAIIGIPYYSISLAFTEGDMADTTVGYVKNLPLGKEYYGINGEGAYVDNIQMKPVKKEDWMFSIYLGSKSLPDSKELASVPRRTRRFGSASLEICMVAEGIFDLYYHRTPNKERSLRITDIAAAAMILREVGGELYNDRWEPVNMSLDPAEREDVIALYDERIREAIE